MTGPIFAAPPPTVLPLVDIVVDQEVQSRLALDPTVVNAYCEAYAAGDTFPPLVVYQEAQDGPYLLADGFHRIEAARRAGLQEHAALVYTGSRRDAVLYAASANVRHGLRPSVSDRIRAAQRLLKDPEWAKWSDREISRLTGLNRTTVGTLRASLEQQGAIGPVPSRVYNRAGKAQTMQTDAIGSPASSDRSDLIVDSDPSPIYIRDFVDEEAEARRRMAFSAREIFMARVGALRSRAVTEIRMLTESGRLYAQRANQLKWNEQDGVAEFYYDNDPLNRIVLSEITIAEFAQQEKLNYRLPNGQIFYYTDSIESLYPLLDVPARSDDDSDHGSDDAESDESDDQSDDEPVELRGSVVVFPDVPPPPLSPTAQFAAARTAQVVRAAEARTAEAAREAVRDTPGRRMLDQLKSYGIEASRVVAHSNGRAGEYTAGFDFGITHGEERLARQAAARYACTLVRAGFDLVDVGCDIEETMTIAGARTPMVRFKETAGR